MQLANPGGVNLRQDPHDGGSKPRASSGSAGQSAACVFLNLGQAAALLGVSERKFHDLRRQGLVPEPVCLGPRALRWYRDELVAYALEHAPRGGAEEPPQLARAKAAIVRQGRSGAAGGESPSRAPQLGGRRAGEGAR